MGRHPGFTGCLRRLSATRRERCARGAKTAFHREPDELLASAEGSLRLRADGSAAARAMSQVGQKAGAASGQGPSLPKIAVEAPYALWFSVIAT
jgi:hypothetical protein